MSQKIENKVVLVTGANRGIGKQIVETFLARGAKKVYLAVRDVTSTKGLEDLYGSRVETIDLDMSDKNAAKLAADRAGDVDILINNAGVLIPKGPLEDDTEQALNYELEVNLYGLLRLVNAFAPVLEKNHGVLVQLNSVVSIRNFSNFATYSISKAASYSLTQALREVLIPKGVQVLSVHPGPIATDMGDTAGFSDAASPKVVAEGIITAIEKGDFHLFPDEVAQNFWGAYQGYSDAFVTANLSGE
ncbi:SDR family oxidoreductase [Neptunicella sp. SCSIO 80796]|uniref:SDR family oxidoreductase n=1 Tax=Neptunicella plasticusilytica TaxID=3117012 RepID=UPI003A4D9001